MKKVVLLFVLAFFIVGCTQNPVPNPSPSSGQPPVLPLSDSRSFDMGFMPIPKQPLSAQNWIDAFSLLEQNADIILHQTPIDWESFQNGTDAERSATITPNLENTNFIVLMAKQKNLKVLLVIDPLTSNHEGMDPNLPSSFGSSFADEKVRTAFKNFAVRIARDYKPDYLGLGSEINTYMEKHPEDAANLVSLISETSSLVKQESPNSQVTATLQFELLNGTANGKNQWEILQQVEPALDAVAVTTYPSTQFATPDQIPDNYYLQIKDHSSKPLVIAESGWPSAGPVQFHGSPENQNRFLNRMVELTKDLKPKVWIYWFLHDWAGEGYSDLFKTMGLLSSDGTEKPAWKTWQQIYSLPK